jgi:DNA polymerase III delta prime subunit
MRTRPKRIAIILFGLVVGAIFTVLGLVTQVYPDEIKTWLNQAYSTNPLLVFIVGSTVLVLAIGLTALSGWYMFAAEETPHPDEDGIASAATSSDAPDKDKNARAATSSDPYRCYEIGIQTLLNTLGIEHPRYADALIYEYRLRENISHARRFEDDTSNKVQRSQVIYQLNILALETHNLSFNELCGISSTPPESDRRERTRLLDQVYNHWNNRGLNTFLQEIDINYVKVDLESNYWSDAVYCPMQSPFENTNKPLPANTKVEEITFHHELLILGEPGIGKTTLLFKLANRLLCCAREKRGEPIPVIFTLSTWTGFVEQQDKGKATLKNWLVEQLKQQYHIPPKIAQNWITKNNIFPLLDGLDEVRQDCRVSCVEAINAHLEEHGLNGIVVCCRTEDYYTIQKKLILREAVMLQPLSEEQIDKYLAQAGDKVAVVRRILHEDKGMSEMAKTPLMLNIMILAYDGTSIEVLPKKRKEGSAALTNDEGFSERAKDHEESLPLQDYQPEELRAHLLNRYVQRMFERRRLIPPQHYTQEQTMRWLSFLAERMVEQGQTILYLEQMQPTWLLQSWQRWFYRIGFGLLFGLIGWVMGGIIGGVVGGVIFGIFISFKKITMTESFDWSVEEAKKGCGQGLIGGLIIGAFAGFLFGLSKGLIGGAIYAFIGGIIFALIVGIIFGLIFGLINKEIPSKNRPNQGTWLSLKNAVFGGLSLGLIGGLSLGLSIELIGKLSYNPIFDLNVGLVGGPILGLSIGAFFVLWNGGFAFVQHFILRFTLALDRTLPLRLVPFLKYATDCIFLQQVGGGYRFIHSMLRDYFVQSRNSPPDNLLIKIIKTTLIELRTLFRKLHLPTLPPWYFDELILKLPGLGINVGAFLLITAFLFFGSIRLGIIPTAVLAVIAFGIQRSWNEISVMFDVIAKAGELLVKMAFVVAGIFLLWKALIILQDAPSYTESIIVFIQRQLIEPIDRVIEYIE